MPSRRCPIRFGDAFVHARMIYTGPKIPNMGRADNPRNIATRAVEGGIFDGWRFGRAAAARDRQKPL